MSYQNAGKGKKFILTGKGYRKTPDEIKAERKEGEPIKGFEKKVPSTWVEKGYVVEM